MEKIWFLVYFVPVFLMHSFMACLSMTQTNFTTDQYALLAFKAHITFNNSDVLAHNWSAATSCCSWIGVTCGAHHQRVTALNLSYMGLTGTIPPHLGNLSFLASLNIRNNSFYGYLPDELFFLRRLKVVNLRYNDFTGTIPRKIGNLTMLKGVYLGGNKFEGLVPQEMGNLINLETLILAYNNLTGSIPSAIFNISSLKIMDFTGNSLSGILPEDMCIYLPILEGLHLSSNQLTGPIPSGFWRCSKLKILSLSFNSFTGSIPREIGNLTLIKNLYLGYNNLTGALPNDMGNLRNLEIFSLEYNDVIGVIPFEIFNISTITILSLATNHLSGPLPSSIGIWLHNLENLYLAQNKLDGIIPSSISNASKLSILELSENSFTGFIPNTLGNLRLLEWLGLQKNFLTTESSSLELSFLHSLTNCKYLRSIDFSYNLIDGILPISIGNLSTSLQSFYASDCKINGSIPKEIGNMSNLIALTLKNNLLTGSIPTTVGRLWKLQALSFGDNKLQGSITYDLCHLQSLVYLYLYGNKLSGLIPACLGNLTYLRYLNLGSNKLTPIIPSTLWSLTDILELNLSANSLSGYLPLDIGNLKAVIQIDLSRNQLSGYIPNTMGGLQNLVNLSLSNNRLQGPIPQSFGSLISLEFLDLSNNNLSGVIPKSLEALLYLKYLNVSFNGLEGEIPNGGPFANFSAQLFMKNNALCGAPRLQVPQCKTSTLQRSRTTVQLRLKYILPAIVSIVLVVVFISALIRCRKRKVKVQTQVELSPLAWRRVSYQELLQATCEFSESNLLGMGSFGSVYKGILSDGLNVAIKVFNLQVEGAFKSFDVECEVLRNIRHRNLIKVISSCSNIDFKALVLEYMPNGSLEKWLYSHNHYLDVLQRLNIMIDVASALEYLHHGYSTPIVHCDLKPSNVLLDEDMVAHVSDFSVAKLLGEEEFMTQTKTLATIGYMAPEYGSEGVVSTKGDVYSYGILLMETFTIKKPTDEMFVEEMSLKRWVKESLPYAVTEVADVNLVRKEKEYLDCISSILELAMDCSVQLPQDRIDMTGVLVRLENIRSKLQINVAGT